MSRTARRLNRDVAYEESVIESLRPKLELLISQLLESGAPLPDPEAVAETMAASVPASAARSEYDRLLGPFYSSAGVMRLLGIPTKQALADRRRRGTVLAARTSDGVWVYPEFQFDVPGRMVRPSLRPILAELKAVPRWGASLWLVTAQDELRNLSPLEAAGDPDLKQQVQFLAADYARAVTT